MDHQTRFVLISFLSPSEFSGIKDTHSEANLQLQHHRHYKSDLHFSGGFAFLTKGDFKGRAMAQVVSRRPLTAEARVRARVNPCGICGGQSGTGTGFSPEFFGFPLSIYHFIVALQTHIIWGMRNMLT
jgi:hypothetical protein